jgi:hypothetical protein
MAKWVQKHETKKSQAVYDLSTIEMRDLHKNGKKSLIAACAANNSQSNME